MKTPCVLKGKIWQLPCDDIYECVAAGETYLQKLLSWQECQGGLQGLHPSIC